MTPRWTWTRGGRASRKHTGELKNLLKNQAFVAGIGNGYSDEILWAAGLDPFRKRSTLAAEEVDRLCAAAREVPAWAIAGAAAAGPAEVRDRGARLPAGPPQGRPAVPTLRRASITEIAPGGFVTSWCRSCQA